MSSNTDISVVPKEEVTAVTVTRFEITQVTIRLFKSAQVIVNLFSLEKFLKCQVIELSEEEYLAWNNDDSYLVDLVCLKLGLVKL